MKEFIIRQAMPDDAEKMAEVIADGREQTYGLDPDSEEYDLMIAGWRGQDGAETMQNYLEAAEEWDFIGVRPRAIVAARLADTAIAGVMTTRELNGGESVNLDFLFVDPNEQGNGLGSKLMDNLTEFAGNRKQQLEVLTNNTRAQRLYQKYGFEIVPGSVHGDLPLQLLEMEKPAVN